MDKEMIIQMAMEAIVSLSLAEVEKTVESILVSEGIEAECSISVKKIDFAYFKKKMKDFPKATHGAVKTVETQIGDAIIRVSEDDEL